MFYRLSSSTILIPLLSISIALVLSGSVFAQQWENIGPHTGSVKHFWPSPLDHALIFARGDLDGDPNDGYETGFSPDQGVSFEPTFPLLEIQYGSDNQNDYWAISEYNFYLHDMFGWNVLSLQGQGGPESGRFLTYQPGSDDTFVLCEAMDTSLRGMDLYLTIDNGQAWTQRFESSYELTNQFIDLAFDPVNPTMLYAIRIGDANDDHSRQFHVSNTYGSTWTPVGNLLYDYSDLRFSPIYDGLVFATVSHPDGSYRTVVSEDHCETWSDLDGPDGESNLTATFLTDGRIAVVTEDGVYTRSDPDAPWSLVDDEFDASIFYLIGCEPYMFSVHLANEEQVYGQCGNLFVRSLDAGATWSINTEGFAQPGQMTVQSCWSNSDILLATGNHHLFFSEDRGESWLVIDSGYDMSGSIHPNNGNQLASWSNFRPWDQSIIRLTQDGGQTWENVDDFGFVEDLEFHPDADSISWVSGSLDGAYGVYCSNDYMNTWYQIPGADDPPLFLHADHLYEGNLYAHSPGSLYRYTYGAQEFVGLGVDDVILQLSLQPDGDGMTVRTQSFMIGLLSDDRGTSFDLEVDYPTMTDGFEITWNGDLLAYGFNHIHVSSNWGLDWNEILSLYQFTLDVDVAPDRTMFAATQFAGIWMLPDALTVDDIEVQTTSLISFSLVGVYPNPFNTATTLVLEIPHPTTATVEVFNVLGRQIETLLLNEPVHAGQTRLAWDARDIPSGTYFVQAVDQSRTRSVQRLVLLK